MNIDSISLRKKQSSSDMDFQLLTDAHHFGGKVAVERVVLSSNTSYPLHYHRSSDAFLLFLEGSGEVVDEHGDCYEFVEGSMVYFPANVRHGFNTKERVVFITVQSPPILNRESGEEDFFFHDASASINDELSPRVVLEEAVVREGDAIERVYLAAFPEEEGATVAQLALDLLAEQTSPETVSLVAKEGDAVIGHVAFSPVSIKGHPQCQAYILAPLAVHPDHQKRGVGTALIEHGMQQLVDADVSVVFVYGDPAYYGRFGFSVEAASSFSAPYKLQYEFGWQAKVLKECAIDTASVAIQCVSPLCDPKLW